MSRVGFWRFELFVKELGSHARRVSTGLKPAWSSRTSRVSGADPGSIPELFRNGSRICAALRPGMTRALEGSELQKMELPPKDESLAREFHLPSSRYFKGLVCGTRVAEAARGLAGAQRA